MHVLTQCYPFVLVHRNFFNNIIFCFTYNFYLHELRKLFVISVNFHLLLYYMSNIYRFTVHLAAY